MNLLIMCLEGFNEIEMTNFAVVMKKAKIFDKIDFYNSNKTNINGMFEFSSIVAHHDIDVNDYEAIYIPGGKGAIVLREDKKALDIINQFLKEEKMVIAICDAPNALYEKGLIDNYSYTSYPIANLKSSDKRQSQKSLVIDNNLLTARSAYFTIDLALEVVKILANEELSKQILEDLKGFLYN